MSKKNRKNLRFEEDRGENLNEQKQDTSMVVHQRSKLKNPLNIRIRSDLTEKQKEFLTLSENKNTKVIFISGCAGTSKTYISVLASLQLLNQKRIGEIVYIRSAVESSEFGIGFIPGDVNAKMLYYNTPILDKLDELLPKNEIISLQKESRVINIPIGFCRGLHWANKSIIIDEAQNITKKELITLITRIGEFSKVFILGDPEQTDIGNKSGFVELTTIFDDDESRKNGIHTFKFNEDDIVRSGLCKFIIKKLKISNNHV
jgi:phosphate starvation-inducible PhoH-like protein